jgi:hypothetical protein
VIAGGIQHEHRDACAGTVAASGPTSQVSTIRGQPHSRTGQFVTWKVTPNRPGCRDRTGGVVLFLYPAAKSGQRLVVAALTNGVP